MSNSFLQRTLVRKVNSSRNGICIRTAKQNRCLGFSLLLLLLNGTVSLPQSSSRIGSSSEIENRVERILARMTLEEKVDLVGGVDDFYIRGVPRLGVPRMKMADGPLGVRNYGPSTAMPGGITLAATWDQALAEEVGKQIGRDARAKGVHFLLGPGVNIYRAPMNGRNFEYFGEDPYLASRIAVGYINGVQSQGVSATVKHFIGNNSEFFRFQSDSVMDERAMREIFLPAFRAAVEEAHVGAIMDAYNLVNGTYATQNGYLNNDIAKKEWGFDGIMMSDWDATHDGVAAANNGLDLEMPVGKFMNRQNLFSAVKQGRVLSATIDDKVRRILRTAVRFGWLDREQTDISVPRLNREGSRVALQTARESMVLLKNEGGLLPLDKSKVKTIAIIGPNAYPAVVGGGGSARVEPFTAVSFLEGLSEYLGDSIQVLYARGIPTYTEMANATSFTTGGDGGETGLKAEYFEDETLRGEPLLTRTEQHINFGSSWRNRFPEGTGGSRWTGFFTPGRAADCQIFVQTNGDNGGFYRLYVDDKLVLDNWKYLKAFIGSTTLFLDPRPHKIVLEQRRRPRSGSSTSFKMGIVQPGAVVTDEAKRIASKSDAVVISAGFDHESEGEGSDRTFNLPPGQDELIKEIAARNKNTVVTITSGGNVDMGPWIDHVPSLLQTWYPGQEGGIALAEILFGGANPSGRLPVTLEQTWEDNPVHNSYYTEAETDRIIYKEGVFVGYRGYEKNGTQMRFPFGFGLSYTTFAYNDLLIKPVGIRKYEIAFTVTNTGGRGGADVPQLYVGDDHSKISRPPKELKGFAKVTLRAGETKRISLILDGRAFSYYDPEIKRWHAEAGKFGVLIGRSSQQIVLRGKIAFPGY